MLDGKTCDSIATEIESSIYSGLLFDRIDSMNETFCIGNPGKITNLGADRLKAAHKNIRDEVDELLDAVDEDGSVDLVAMSDCLGDLFVYVVSEAVRWGIPLVSVIHIILDSQVSKLEDGKPVMSEDGSKFIKGKHYVAPEPKIKELIDSLNAMTFMKESLNAAT